MIYDNKIIEGCKGHNKQLMHKIRKEYCTITDLQCALFKYN